MKKNDNVDVLKNRNTRTPLYPFQPRPFILNYTEETRWKHETISQQSVTQEILPTITRSGSRSGLRRGTHWRFPTTRSRSQLVVTDVSGERLTEDSTYLHTTNCRGQFPPLWINLTDTDFVNRSGGPVSDYNIEQRLNADVMNKLTDGALQLGADLGEAKTTLSMIAKTSIDVITSLRALKRGNVRDALKPLGIARHSFKNSSRDVSGRWLELQYGWLPLLNTIHDAVELNRKRAREGKLPMRVARTITTPFHSEYQPRGLPYSTSCSGQRSCRIIMWYTIEDDRRHLLAQLGLNNPASIAWELTPYSFLFDWFVPVGNVLNAWSASSGLKFISATRTWRVSGTSTITTDWSKKSSLYSGISSASLRFDGYTRQALRSWPYPFFYWKSPFSTKHVLNAIALINQRWK